MKLQKLILRICLCAIIGSALFIGAIAAFRANLPPTLQALDIKISSFTTQRANYEMTNSSQVLSRRLVRYTAKDGSYFCFDSEDNITAYRAATPDDSTETANAASFRADQITREHIDSLLSAYIPDLSEFDCMEAPAPTEYGYDITLRKNASSVCEDDLILRLDFSGGVRSFNLVRSGISDPSEVDTEYFDEQLSLLLAETADAMISYEVGYQKLEGVVFATYSVELEDSYGGRYVKTYMIS